MTKKYLIGLLCCALASCQAPANTGGIAPSPVEEQTSNIPNIASEQSAENTAQSDNDNNQPEKPKSLTINEKDTQNLKAFIEAEMKKQNIPGIAVAIVKPGKTLFSAGYGMADIAKNKAVTPETLFILASISKTITYTHVLQQVDKGLLQLDESIDTYLPFKTGHPDFPEQKITVRMLLNHSASIKDNDEIDVYSRGVDTPISLKSFMTDYFSESGKYYDPDLNYVLDKSPGTHFNYTNMGTALAGFVVESAKKVDFAKSTQDELLKPLGMDTAGWYLKNINLNNVALPYKEDNTPFKHYTFADYPNGQLRSSVNELSHFLAMIMNFGHINGNQILSKKLATDLRKEGVPGSGYGLGFSYNEDLEGRNLFGHTGSEQGTTTAMLFDIQTQTGALVFMNKQDKDHIAILEALLTIGDDY